MANHRPKSLSELNNVYDKAMRAERAIKESSELLSTPETENTPGSENIFEQLETKAAEAQKNQIFDPDITDIANDFLKRYAQPEKPKPAPKEIKRPAPSIQVYHTPVKTKEPENVKEAPVQKPQSAPVHKPAFTVPAPQTVKSEVVTPEVKAPVQAAVPVAPVAPEVKAADTKAPVRAAAPTKVDHTPRPTPSRARITSTERSELMEEYMRVMSDDDDEPTFRKPKFSFFKKKKKHEAQEDFEAAENLYDEVSQAEDSAEEEVPVVSFDSSPAEYENEYSESPQDGFITEDDTLSHEPMNLYDYIEADFDYEIADEYAEDSAEASSQVQEVTQEASDDIAEITEEADEEVIAELPTEAEEYQEDTISEEAPAEDFVKEPSQVSEEETAETEDAFSSVQEPEEIIPQEDEAIEEIVPLEEEEASEDAPEVQQEVAEAEEIPEAEEISFDTPTAGMVFEDIFSVSDESKRSHTGGNWNEVFGDRLNEEQNEDFGTEETDTQDSPLSDTQEAYKTYEEESAAEAQVYYALEEAEAQTPQSSEEPEEIEAEKYPQDEQEEAEEVEEAEEFEESVKSKLPLKIVLSLSVVLCIVLAGISVFATAFLGVDTGKIFSDKYRAFSVPETVAELGINKGDLVITENIYASADELYVFKDETDLDYKLGKVTATTSNLSGDYLYITVTADGTKLINRDTSMGVVKDTYARIGSVLSALCSYGIYIAIACAVFAIALIICLIIIIRKQRRYEAAAAIYDNPDNFKNDDDDNDDTDGNDNDNSEYYSDYDTDGIEQGLFAEL